MRWCFLFLIIILFYSCSENGNRKNKTVYETNDTVPGTRTHVSKKPVASYWIQMGNPKLERKFGVDVYETVNTFKYVLAMQYDAMPQSDSLELPNFGIWPKIKIIPGKQNLSCIIGFEDAKGNFREYKLLSAKDNQLRLSTLKYYSTTEYYR